MWIIYAKEMLELARDRKTFIFTVIIPIIAMPLIFGGLALISSVMFRNAQQAQLTYAIFGQANAPQLAQRFAREKSFREVALAGPEAIRDAIASDRIKFALVIPDGFNEQLGAHHQASLALHYNNAVAVDITKRRVLAVVEAQNSALREAALAALNMNKDQLRFALNPIKLVDYSTADKREQMGAVVGGFLPYILLVVCLMAAMYPAIDLGAGEKERGTLETLLLAPLPRGAIVQAKFLVLFTVGLTSAVLMVLSMALLLFVFGDALEGVRNMVRAIGVGDLAMVMLMLVPTAAIFAAVLLSISLYAKSYKEASGLVSPLMMLIIVPSVIAVLPGVELNWFWAMVPLTNVSLAMKELVKGTMDYRMFWVILLSTTLIAGAMLSWCRWWCNREQVLFRN